MHDLGELPALDWSNASVKLLVITIVIGIILFTRYSGYLNNQCVKLGRFCLRAWLNGLCVAAGAYFVIELLAKVSYGQTDGERRVGCVGGELCRFCAVFLSFFAASSLSFASPAT